MFLLILFMFLSGMILRVGVGRLVDLGWGCFGLVMEDFKCLESVGRVCLVEFGEW